MLCALAGCRISRDLLPSGEPRVTKAFRRLDIASQYHTGISLYDPQKEKWVLRFADHQRFTPASNIKIVTLFAALQHIGDNLDAAWYTIEGDSVIIWGGGDPGAGYPAIDAHHPLIDFVAGRSEPIVFSQAHFQTSRFGAGWAWDDFAYQDQIERTAFPLYGNRLWIQRTEGAIKSTPQYLMPLISVRADRFDRVERSEWGDQFFYTYNPSIRTDMRQVPVSFLDNDIRMYWQEATQRDITMGRRSFPASGMEVVKGSYRDTLLRRMMQESDNFIAEQLLLNISMSQLGVMSESAIIDSLLHSSLKTISGELNWVDGSGLSRYNQMTPRSVIWLLDQLYQQQGLEFVLRIFPAGGQSGTLRHTYPGPHNKPFVYAKTGSLKHVHCLSGYLVTRKGRVLIFSWMHNQFKGDLNSIRKSMHDFFLFLYEHY